MFSNQYVDDLLLEVVFHILFVEPSQCFKSMVHNAFEVSFTCSGDICVGRASACVMLWNCVTIIGPCIFQLDDHAICGLCIISCFEDSVCPEYLGNIKPAFSQYGIQCVICNLRLNQVSSIQTINTVNSHYTILKRDDFFLINVLSVVLEISIYWSYLFN